MGLFSFLRRKKSQEVCIEKAEEKEEQPPIIYGSIEEAKAAYLEQKRLEEEQAKRLVIEILEHHMGPSIVSQIDLFGKSWKLPVLLVANISGHNPFKILVNYDYLIFYNNTETRKYKTFGEALVDNETTPDQIEDQEDEEAEDDDEA